MDDKGAQPLPCLLPHFLFFLFNPPLLDDQTENLKKGRDPKTCSSSCQQCVVLFAFLASAALNLSQQQGFAHRQFSHRSR